MTAIRHVKAFTRQIPVYSKEGIDERIESILDNFPFDSVGRVMTALNWTWRGEAGPPTENEMRDTARRLLKQAAEMHPSGTTPRTIGTGGFRASRENSGVLHLEFVAAAQYDTYCDEDTEGNPAAPGFVCVSLRGPRKEKPVEGPTP